MDKHWVVFFGFWFAIAAPMIYALALHKVSEWLDGPDPHLGCPDPVEQDRHNEAQHGAVISTAVNLRPYKRGDLAVKK